MVMVIELLGSRIIGPPFGVSLFIWTSLITVALVSLALGYWFGGALADRKTSHGALFWVIFLAGVFVLSIPLTRGFIIGSALSLGLRAGSLASSVALFGPPLFLLGIVSPYIVRLYMSSEMGVGRTVGRLYAVSTFGSFIGTVLTGFVLIPGLGVNNIIYLTAFILFALSAGYWAFFRQRLFAAAVLALPVILASSPADLPSTVRTDGVKVTVIEKSDSPYGQIKVVDYSYGDTNYREFLLENMIQGTVDTSTGLPVSRYTYYAEQLGLAYSPASRRALVIGLGSGILPQRFSAYGIETDVVEIDPGVVETASKHFSYDRSRHRTFIQDGRYFLNSAGEAYDIIFVDAFSGDTPPSHLVSLEAFELMKRRLTPDGVLVMNFIGESRTGDALVPSMVKETLGRVFPNVEVYTSPAYFSDVPRAVNMIFVAWEGARTPDEGFMPRDFNPDYLEDLKGIYSRKVSLGSPGFAFTDDYNPIDFYDLGTRERLREYIISNTDREIFIY